MGMADLPAPNAGARSAVSTDAREHLREALSRSANRFTRIRHDTQTDESTLRAIVAGALEVVPAARSASISLMDRAGVVTTHAPSDELVAEIDGLQAELGEGPCVDALRETGDDVVDVPDLADPDRAPWPRLMARARARAAGFASVLSYRLVARDSTGALNLWGGAPGRFTDHDRLVGALFADQAAVALAGARRARQLNAALISRDMIGRAKGVLMERFRVPDAAAFAMLVESSQNTNIKLADVAAWLVDDAEAGYARGSDAPVRERDAPDDDGRVRVGEE